LRRPRSPALASPRGVAVRLGVLTRCRSSALSGYALPLRSSPEGRAMRCSSRHPRRVGVTRATILPRGSALLQGLLPEAAPQARRPRPPLLGFLALQRHQPGESTRRRGSQVPATFRLQGFAPSCRFPPPRASRACFIPEALMGFALQGLPLPRSRAASSAAAALLAFAYGCAPHRPRIGGTRRPRPGSRRTRDTAVQLASRALLPSRVRSRRHAVKRAAGRSPLGLRPL